MNNTKITAVQFLEASEPFLLPAQREQLKKDVIKNIQDFTNRNLEAINQLNTELASLQGKAKPSVAAPTQKSTSAPAAARKPKVVPRVAGQSAVDLASEYAQREFPRVVTALEVRQYIASKRGDKFSGNTYQAINKLVTNGKLKSEGERHSRVYTWVPTQESE